jgi:hypothetical protein
MCLPLLCVPLVMFSFQMDHMMPFEPQHPNLGCFVSIHDLIKLVQVFTSGILFPWELYKLVDNLGNFILQDAWFHNHCWFGLQLVLLVPIEEGFGDVMEKLRDVLELLLFDMESHCRFDYLEWSSSQPKAHVQPSHTPFLTQSVEPSFLKTLGSL